MPVNVGGRPVPKGKAFFEGVQLLVGLVEEDRAKSQRQNLNLKRLAGDLLKPKLAIEDVLRV
jgi:hypothetical protein